MKNLNRYNLEHIIKAAGKIAEDDKVIILGSNAILAYVENPPFECSREIDIAFFNDDSEEKATKVDGSIGELSIFQETHEYFAHGISIETAVMPNEWESRVRVISNENTDGIKGYCISLEDLAASKLVAGREKDIDFVSKLIQHRIIAAFKLEKLLEKLPEKRTMSSGLVFNPKTIAKQNFIICKNKAKLPKTKITRREHPHDLDL